MERLYFAVNKRLQPRRPTAEMTISFQLTTQKFKLEHGYSHAGLKDRLKNVRQRDYLLAYIAYVCKKDNKGLQSVQINISFGIAFF